MAARRTTKSRTQNNSHLPLNRNGENEVSQGRAQLTLIKCRPKLDHLLRSRCRLAFIVISVLAMLVVIRSGISASRGYALVETHNQAQRIEQENERLRIEIARLKSPQRIQQIASEELGMGVPNKMYFSHEK